VKFDDISGAQLVVEVLRAEGIDTVFGNSGTTEIDLMRAFNSSPDLRYVLGLHEGAVMGMAEGYARALRKPSFVNLHAAVGIANALTGLYGCLTTKVPLVVTAGQQDLRHLLTEPLLASDPVAMVRPVVKWAHEVRYLAELAPALHRAFRQAMTPPQGPVFVSLPVNVMAEQGSAETQDVAPVVSAQVGQVDALADLLCSTPVGEIGVVLSADVDTSGAGPATLELAETLGSPVWGAPFTGINPFPTGHRLWRGYLPPMHADGITDQLVGIRRVLYLGRRLFPLVHYASEPLLPEVELLQMAETAEDLGRTRPIRLGVAGDLPLTVARLSEAIRQRSGCPGPHPVDPLPPARVARRGEATGDAEAERGLSGQPVPAPVLSDILVRTVPQDTLLVDEAHAVSQHLRTNYVPSRSGRYFWGEGCGLGWGMPFAVGLSLGYDRELVVCVVGDGTAMFCPQALWNAARERVPVVFVVVDNGRYEILKSQLKAIEPNTRSFVGMDIDAPPVDFTGLSSALGVEALRAHDAGEFEDALKVALHRGSATLIHVDVA